MSTLITATCCSFLIHWPWIPLSVESKAGGLKTSRWGKKFKDGEFIGPGSGMSSNISMEVII